VEGVDVKRFVFQITEIDTPYLSCFVGLNPQYQEMAEQKIETGLALWKKMLKEDSWEGYPKRICYLEPRPWVMAQWEERRFDIQLTTQEEM